MYLYFLISLGLFCLAEGLALPKQLDEPITRIVGGKNAPESGVPYQVSLRTNSNSHFCGGSIINDKWILTAAHCTVSQSNQTMHVVVGTNRLSSGGKKYSVEKIIVHENYNDENITNDVSVIKVTKRILFNNRVQPIQLPDNDTVGGADVVLTGWGRLSFPGRLPDKLQTINLTALSVTECQEIYSKVPTPTIQDTQICTLTKRGEGACQGDSGGPLVEGDRVVGIVSWGMPCARGYPDIYARVLAFKEWILEKTNTTGNFTSYA